MKTIKVRPILVESKEKIQLNSIVLHAVFGLGQIIMDSEVECFYNRHKSGGSITTPWERNLKGRLLHYDLVLISLDPDEKIEKGDWFVNEQPEGVIALWQHNGNMPNGNPKKVIAISSKIIIMDENNPYDPRSKTGVEPCICNLPQLSPELIQYLINQYNDGGMEDFEIEMEEECSEETIATAPGFSLKAPSNMIHVLKLTDDFITPVEKQYPIGEIEHKEWFKQNKKKL